MVFLVLSTVYHLNICLNYEPRQDGRSSSDQFDLPPFHRPKNHRHVFVNKYRDEIIGQKHHLVRREGPAHVAQRSKDVVGLGLQLWRQGNQARALTRSYVHSIIFFWS